MGWTEWADDLALVWWLNDAMKGHMSTLLRRDREKEINEARNDQSPNAWRKIAEEFEETR